MVDKLPTCVIPYFSDKRLGIETLKKDLSGYMELFE